MNIKPPLVNIKNKSFKYINNEFIYPIIMKIPDKGNYVKKQYFSAPYYQYDSDRGKIPTDIFNVYISYDTLEKADNMANAINNYYKVECETIKELRVDMEHYSANMNTPFVIISNYDEDEDLYELSYYCNINNKNDWLKANNISE